ncbi:Protein-S-isoprenylcysteine O-methyltransferase [Trichinella nelsoni]|uniref:Protein-S-isoprenylcysteine O-methyltransferase n=2 Tax=Trichinella TaxID=6333 RepID=A0A0V0SGD6_9BILA|nr:Protein-S-isoprenylcysteine O-methyltransferase [Trichinella nelsoni]
MSTTRYRTPALKTSTGPSLQVAGLQALATTPGNYCLLLLSFFCLRHCLKSVELSFGQVSLLLYSSLAFVVVILIILKFFISLDAVCNDDTLSIDSFLLNHSVEYWLAAILSWLEYFVEYYYFPSLKHVALISKCGFMLTITGEVVRKLAIYTAGKGFSHLVSTKRKETHKLVTTGVYHFWRHPAYLGWLLWSVGTQLILCNPVCFVGYSYVSWKFLKQRIQIEESYLVQFFGNEYLKYREEVPSGIPFVD